MSSIERTYARNIAKNKMKKAGYSKLCKHKNGNQTNREDEGSYFAKNWGDYTKYKRHPRTYSNKYKKMLSHINKRTAV